MFREQASRDVGKAGTMARGIEYVVDEKGRRKSVIMSYKAYAQLMEDLDDLRVKMERQDETAEDFEAVLAELRNAGKV